MKRLQTYFAVLATILSVGSVMVALIASSLVDLSDSPLLFAWGTLLASICIFVLSFVVGGFIADPLRDLHRKVKALVAGDVLVEFHPDGRLHEADELSEDISALASHAKTRMTDLAVQQKRQTQFISDVAHELRTPLTAIRGNAETLMDPDMPDALRERFCQTIINESERLTRLCNDLMALQHIEDGTDQTMLQRVNLHSVAANVADSLSHLIEDRHGVIQVIGEAPDVLGNPDRLQQVVYNLVANACRFIGEGGHVTVKLEGLKGQSVISVIDDGPGFGDIDPKLLFTRFYRGDNSRARNTGGTGLGLSIVKGVVDSHDGTIEAFNTAQGGACFVVALPSIQEHIQ